MSTSPANSVRPFDSLHPPVAIPSRGRIDPDLRAPTPMLRRPGCAVPGVKTLLLTSVLTSALAATFVGFFVVGSSPPATDRAGLPEFASHETRRVTLVPMLQAVPPSTEFGSVTAESGAERETRPGSLHPKVSLQPAASLQMQSENHPTESQIEAMTQTVPGSEYETLVSKTAATPVPPLIVGLESPPIAAPEPPSIVRPEPAPEPPLINHAPPRSNVNTVHNGQDTEPYIEPGKVVGPDRAGFFFADSNVRYLTRAELQELSADQLHVARNEIFARRGRYFKDDALRTYFSQFSWYQPHVWHVPLSLVERANIGLIQSIEAHPTAPGTVSASPPARTKVENGVTFADPGRRYLMPEELQGLTTDQLVIARNEIFARRGRYFKNNALRAYFSRFPWYQPYAWDVALSPVEQANVKLVQSMEQAAAAPRQTWRIPPM